MITKPGDTVEFYLKAILIRTEIVLQTDEQAKTFTTTSGTYTVDDLDLQPYWLGLTSKWRVPLTTTLKKKDRSSHRIVEESLASIDKVWTVTKHLLELGKVTIGNTKDPTFLKSDFNVYCEIVVSEYSEPGMQFVPCANDTRIEVNVFPIMLTDTVTDLYLQKADCLTLETVRKQKVIKIDYMKHVSTEDTTGSGKYKTVKYLAESYRSIWQKDGIDEMTTTW